MTSLRGGLRRVSPVCAHAGMRNAWTSIDTRRFAMSMPSAALLARRRRHPAVFPLVDKTGILIAHEIPHDLSTRLAAPAGCKLGFMTVSAPQSGAPRATASELVGPGEITHADHAPVRSHERFTYSPIRPPPASSVARRRFARCLRRLEHRAFRFRRRPGCRHRSAAPATRRPELAWREYGNRVGVWRCLDLFDALGIAHRRADQHCAVRSLPGGGGGLRGARRRDHRARTHQRGAAGRLAGGARARAARGLPRSHRACDRARASGLAVAVDIGEHDHPGPAGRRRLRLHAQLVPRRSAGAHAHAQRKGAMVRCPTRRRSTTSR